MKTTTFSDCTRDLIAHGGSGARQAHARWIESPRGFSESDTIRIFRHKHLYAITREDVRDVASRTDHALGDIQALENIPEARDYNGPYTLQHLFHRALEEMEEIPTWQDFWFWLRMTVGGLYVEPFARKFGLDPQLMHLAHDHRARRYWRALQWRLGCFYYSALRELDIFASLRERHGLDLNYHLFADIVLKVDFWIDDVAICIYMPNGFYRSENGGRKTTAKEIFGSKDSAITIVDFETPQEKAFGKTWFASDWRIAQMAAKIKESQYSDAL